MSPDALTVGEPPIELPAESVEKDLPPAWEWAPLGMLASVISRGRAPNYVERDGVIVLNQRCIRWGRIDFKFAKRTSSNSVAKYPPHLIVRDGDILWNSTGSGTIGRAAIYRNETSPTPDNAVYIDTHITLVRCEHCNPEYIQYFSRTLHVQKIIADLNVGSTNQLELPRSVVAELTIPLPPLAEQRRIVVRIDQLFAEIAEGEAALQRARRDLGTWRRALLKAAVTGELTRDWREINRATETGAALLARTKAQRAANARNSTRRHRLIPPPESSDAPLLPELPAGWTWTTIGELFDVYTGSTPSRAEPDFWGGDIPWISSGEVAFCRIKETREYITRAALGNSLNRVHPSGTVLLAMIGEGKTRGQCAILDIEACNNQNAAAIRVSETQIPPEFIYLVLEERYLRSHSESQGGNQPALNAQKVASIPVPLPPAAEVDEIVRSTRAMAEGMADVVRECVDIDLLQIALRQSILKAAFEAGW